MKSGEPWAVKLRDQGSIGDFRKWKDRDAYRQAFNRILRDLKTMPDDAERFRAAAHKA